MLSCEDIFDKVHFLQEADRLARDTNSPVMSGCAISAVESATLDMIEALNAHHVLIAKALLEINNSAVTMANGAPLQGLITIGTVRELSQMLQKD